MRNSTPPTYRLWLARAVAGLHIAVIVVMALGWLLPWPWAWWSVLVGGVILQTIWCLWRNQCPLTVLEARLRGESFTAKEQPRPFVSNLLSRVLGQAVSNRTGNCVAYGVLYVSLFLCVRNLMG